MNDTPIQNQAPTSSSPNGPTGPTGSFVALGTSMSNQPAPQDQTTQALPDGVTPDGMTFGAPVAQDTPVPADGLTFGPPATSDIHVDANGKPESTLTMRDSDSVGTKLGKGIAGIFSGAGEGVFSTAAGLTDLINKLPTHDASGKYDPVIPQAVSDYLHHLAGDDEVKANAETVGYAGETLAEFFLGDAALKGLPMAKKLEMASKTMKVVEQSPKMMKALKIGAQVLHDAPILEESLRAGAVGGAQTYVRTGGDAEEAAKEGLGTGAVTFGTGEILQGVGKVAKATGAAGKAADTFQGLSDRAKAAISQEGVFGGLGRAITSARQTIDNIFEGAKLDKAAGESAAANARAAEEAAAKDTLNNNKEDLEAGYQANKAKTANVLEQNKASAADKLAKDQEELQTRYTNSVAKADDLRDKALQTAKDDLEEAKQAVTQQFTNALKQLAEGSQTPEEAAKALDAAITQAEANSHTIYENGINGENGIATQLQGQLSPYQGSESAKAATKGLNTPQPADNAVTKAAKDISGDKIDANTKKLLTMISEGKEPDVVSGSGKKSVTTPGQALAPRTINDLIRERQAIREAAAGYMRGDINRKVLSDVIDGIDKDIETMANNAGNPSVKAQYDLLRKNYRESRAVLDSDTADALKLNKVDKQRTDITKYLTTGSNVPGKLNALTFGANPILSPEAMQELARTRVGEMAAEAEANPSAFARKWNNPNQTPSYIKDKFFGPELSKQINDAVTAFQEGQSYAEQKASEAIDKANADHQTLRQQIETRKSQAAAGIKDSNKQQLDSAQNLHDAAMAGHDTNKTLFGKAIDAQHNDALKKISDRYNAAAQDLQDKFDQAKADYTTKSAPFEKGIFPKLAEGRVNDALIDGKIDLQDVRQLKEMSGDKWQDIADGLFQRGLVKGTDASGNVIPKKPEDILKWWDSWDPDVRREMFNLDSPEAQKAYADTMNDLRDSLAVKTLLRNGLLFTGHVGATAGGLAIGALGKGATPLQELIGAASGSVLGATGHKLIAEMVDYVANHPNTWKALKVAGNAGNAIAPIASGLAPDAGKITKAFSKSTYTNPDVKRRVYSGTAGALGGNQ